jgi:hypothetical protein
MIYFVAVLSVVLVLIGGWGRRRASELVPSTLPADVRQKNERVMRRGAWVLQVVGAVLLCCSLVGIGYLLVGPR